MIQKKISLILIFIFVFLAILGIASTLAARSLKKTYENRASGVIRDRRHTIIRVRPNALGYYALYTGTVPETFRDRVLRQEDRFFYLHPGFNPGSILRAAGRKILGRPNRASSTITQQLTKLLLSHENDRTFKNKLVELFYAVSLEIHTSKEEILRMYANSIYLGNNVQGITAASALYFGSPPEKLTETNIDALVTAIPNPVRANPFAANRPHPLSAAEIQKRKTAFSELVKHPSAFEAESSGLPCSESCTLSIDDQLTATLRGILQKNLSLLSSKNANNGAIIVVKLPENEILSMIGSPDPFSLSSGYQINMALEPRPIGSTVKPFIYLKGFEKGLRPYTLVDDQEYRYTIGSGFAFYPKNFDYTYHGRVTLHHALANSLNVPTVKVLEYVGLEAFYRFLEDDLSFQPIQPLESYQLGIALGGLEMDLMQLAHFMTIFPNHGSLRPLSFLKHPGTAEVAGAKKISEPKFTELINIILSDRTAGIEEFGLKSSLNLPYKNYAVKTGTSREYHDSWTIGYTPDFLVGVWVGNSDNTPMDAVSGLVGAGDIWHEAMNVLYASSYHRNTPFSLAAIREYQNGNTKEYGLPEDRLEEARALLTGAAALIVKPHDGDDFLWDPRMVIPLEARQTASWLVNGESAGTGERISFSPAQPGVYTITAQFEGREESIRVLVSAP